MLVKNPPADSFSSVEKVGVAIRHVPGGHHLAFLYLWGGKPRLLHLTNLEGIHEFPPDDKYCWIQCGLDEYTKLVVAALCQDISLNSVSGRRPTYHFLYNGEYFDVSGSYVAAPTVGLTCSTFILAVFRTLKIELLKIDEWPPAQNSDLDAQMGITMAIALKNPTLLNKLQDEWGAPRFRPGQVAAAASISDHPLGYTEASKKGGQIERRLKQLRPILTTHHPE